MKEGKKFLEYPFKNGSEIKGKWSQTFSWKIAKKQCKEEDLSQSESWENLEEAFLLSFVIKSALLPEKYFYVLEIKIVTEAFIHFVALKFMSFSFETIYNGQS